MRKLRALFVIAWRESRTARRRLLLYMSSISLGVAALVAIDSFSANVTASVHEQSRSLLGGDVALSTGDAWSPAAQAVLDSLHRSGIGVARSTNFPSMGFVPRSGGTRLVQVRAVSPSYPWYGTIVTAPAPAWRSLQAGRNVVVDPSLLVSLEARLGDTLRLGNSSFVITGTLESVPGEVGISAAIGPRVYIPDRYLKETGLLVFGSRASYEAVLKLPAGLSPARFAARFRPRLATMRVRLRTVAENEYNLNEAIDQLRDFLNLVSLVALLLGGIGVASGVHAFVMRKIDTVAVLRCVGASSWQVLAIYALQAIAMGLAGAAAGVALGVIIQFALPRVMSDFLPVDVTVRLAPASIGLGLLIGVWVALVFAMRPLVALRRVSPLQALRRESDAEALSRGRYDPLRLVIELAIVVSVLLLGVGRADTVRRGISFSIAIAVAIALLWTSATAMSAIARRVVRPQWPFVLRQGIANLYRPANQTRAVVLALGFGVFLMSTLYQVQQNLLRSLDLKMGQARANIVFFDVQQDQASGIDSVLRTDRDELVEQTPLVITRIEAINSKSTAQLLADTTQLPPDSAAEQSRGRRPLGPGAARGGRRRAAWPLRREYRSTFRPNLTSSERIVAGRWLDKATDSTSLPWISVESGVARELRLAIGDTVTWNVEGVRVPTVVRSFREVNWARFEPNFFVVFDPRALEHAPKQFVILARAATGEGVARLQRTVVAKYANVSSLDLTLIQRTVVNVLAKVTMAMRFMALISLALGIPVLFSAVAATRRERLREGVLFKTLGATRRQIGRIMFAEYALLGGLGSLTGVVLSVGGAWALMHGVFRMPFVPAVVPALAVALAMIVAAVAIGLLTGREVFAQTPMVALRDA